MDYSNASERRNIILEHLKNDGQVFLNELADAFNVSQETTRRMQRHAGFRRLSLAAPRALPLG